MSKKWFELARKENSQWNGLVAEFHPSSSLLHRSPLLSIRPNRFSSKIFFFPLKRATAAGWPVKRKGGRGIKRRRRRSLAGLLCSVLFHCESNRHSLGSPFCLTTAMALASAAPLSFSLSFEDNVHYCCWEEENPRSLAGAQWVHVNATITCERATMRCPVGGGGRRVGGRRLFWNICSKTKQKSATSLFSVSVHKAAPVICLL